MTRIEVKHKKEVEKLNKLEAQLTELISILASDLIKDKFLQWQVQRNNCNSLYNEWLAETLKK